RLEVNLAAAGARDQETARGLDLPRAEQETALTARHRTITLTNPGDEEHNRCDEQRMQHRAGIANIGRLASGGSVGMRALVAAAAVVVSIGLTAAASAESAPYIYDAAKSGPVSFGPARTLAPGITARAIEYLSASGKKVTGEIVTGAATSPQPGLLFVHWLG